MLELTARISKTMVRTFITSFCCAALIFLLVLPTLGEQYSVRVVTVKNGDTLTIADSLDKRIEICLLGIDAPEKGQPYAKASRQGLASLVQGKTVIVELSHNKEGGLCGTLFLSGNNINATMVYHGLAWSSSDSRYGQLEQDARNAKRGLWKDRNPVRPSDYRKRAKQNKLIRLLLGLAIAVVIIRELTHKRKKKQHGQYSPESAAVSKTAESQQGNLKSDSVIDLSTKHGIRDWFFMSDSERRGELGELDLLSLLEQKLPLGGTDGYRIVRNLMLEDAAGATTQIDLVIVSPYGVFVVEVKNFRGWIFGTPDQAKWTVSVRGGRKYQFQNPIRQNYKHLRVLSEKTGVPMSLLFPIIAFGDSCEFKTPFPKNVMHCSAVPEFIRTFSEQVIKPEQLNEIVDTFVSWDQTIDEAKKLNHVQNLKEIHAAASVYATNVICPVCGNRMILRNHSGDGHPFWGCSKYPACKGIREAKV